MFEGLFSTSMTFTGVYRYASVADLEAAVDAVEQLLEAEDAEFATDFDKALRRRGHSLRVHIDTQCPRDWYYAYATLVEALAERAISGAVDAKLAGSDRVESYVAAAAEPARATEPSLETPRSRDADQESITVVAEAPVLAVDTLQAALAKAAAAVEVHASAMGSEAQTIASEAARLVEEVVSEVAGSAGGSVADTTSAETAPATAMRQSVAERVSAATAELVRPKLMQIPELSSIAKLMTIPELSIPQLVLVPELMSLSDLRSVSELVSAAAEEMVSPDEPNDVPARPAQQLSAS